LLLAWPTHHNKEYNVTRWSPFRTSLTLLAAFFSLAVPVMASADTIYVYDAPVNTYGITAESPCIFFGPGNCPGPSGWLTPQGPTNTTWDGSTLTQTYEGADLDLFKDLAGSSFVLGLDVHDSNGLQTLTNFSATFYTGATSTTYTLGAPQGVPSLGNSNWFADYVLAPGCSPVDAVTTCSGYEEFVLDPDATKVVFTFGLDNSNDGADKIFLIQPPAESSAPIGDVPEPGLLAMFGAGLFAIGRKLTRRVTTV
jgi:hypothetical protein